MSDDLVKRLREGVWGRARRADAVIHAAMQDGAEHIESQAARIAELEAALERIAAAGGLFAEPASGQHAREIARAALAGGKS